MTDSTRLLLHARLDGRARRGGREADRDPPADGEPGGWRIARLVGDSDS